MPILFYKEWWISSLNLYNTKTWQILAIASIWIGLIIRLLIRFTNFEKRHSLVFLNTLTVILLIINHYSYKENYIKKQGIIFSSSVIVNSAPTYNSADLFSLHSGSKVEIIDSIGEWINIKITNGNKGWIEKESCKQL